MSEISSGLSNIAYFRTDGGSSKLYTQEYVNEKHKEINRLNNIINYIWQVFENGSFEDGCDCIKIYDYLKELKENK